MLLFLSCEADQAGLLGHLQHWAGIAILYTSFVREFLDRQTI
jgi:hypothetical protein